MTANMAEYQFMVSVRSNQDLRICPRKLLGEISIRRRNPTTVGGNTIGIVRSVSRIPLTAPESRATKYAARIPVTSVIRVAISEIRRELKSGNRSISGSFRAGFLNCFVQYCPVLFRTIVKMILSDVKKIEYANDI